MEAWSIDGVAASAAPFSVSYQDTIIGTDHNNAPIFAGKVEVVLSFDNTTLDYYQQWHDAASSGGSHTVDILNRDSLTWRTCSQVYLKYEQPPTIEDIHVTPFSIRITNINRV